ncbi:glutamate-cysteine ligase family protein [Actinoplanes sp. NBRC 101535]|uniref:carboxylate-amine ligase n=1 Tax=Actinoplanes sp. NBRC 101535 TaxID=3032196 RepID=UPI0025545CFC|nr:glutamate-cysteine ligase family protein [Actinoplanes sp. NBRC 101535]
MTAHRSPAFQVNEEFLLLDPARGTTVPAGPALLRLLDGRPGPRPALMRYQVCTATATCHTTGELRDELSRLRTLVTEGARSLGCTPVAGGTAPYGTPGLRAVSGDPRSRALALRHPALTALSGVCGCRVQVGVPSRDLAARVAGRLTPWLATLLAISANSPITDGHDTGWASNRYPALAQWPTVRVPGPWTGTADYDRSVQLALHRGAPDERGVGFLARPGPDAPTVRVHVADTCPDTAATLLLAILVRALVVTTTAEIAAGGAPQAVPPSRAAAGLLAAAHHGLAGPGLDPCTGRAVPAWDLVARLIARIAPALDELGDAATAACLLGRLRERGTGADRQRTLWAGTGSPARVVAGLATMTGAGVLSPPMVGEPAVTAGFGGRVQQPDRRPASQVR